MDTDVTKTLSAAHLAPQPRINVLGLDYLHLRLDDGSDFYVTTYGRPFMRQLLPENHWGDKAWFRGHSVRLPGTSALHKISTKYVDGISIDIVMKWNRMGQDIPGETEASDLDGAEFNSPFEEFSLVMEMRNTRCETLARAYTHKPLAIYVPRKYVEAERMGRKAYKMEGVQRKHGEIRLDVNRQYAVIYEWIKGVDAAQAFTSRLLGEETMVALVRRADQEMNRRGFRVRDSKPHHVIVRPTRNGAIARSRQGDILYALVDFELLERTPQREQMVRASRRKTYLVKQAHRFEVEEEFPPSLTPVNIMGVDYVYGQVESTDGRLWVVGKDPALFEYFLPEKWRKTPRKRLSVARKVYYTLSKDGIHLVWLRSSVGKKPLVDPLVVNEKAVLAHGYNSPFEEVSLCMELARKGIDTIYPRAIYMTGRMPEIPTDLVDDSRYQSHAALQTPEMHPILARHHDHIIIWGYWNGPDELLAAKDEELYRGIDAFTAREEGRITQEEYARVVQATEQRLSEAEVEDLNLRGSHLLLSLDRSGRLAVDQQGIPVVRICNFELLRRTATGDTDQ